MKNNNLEIDNLRIEIAILQQSVSAKSTAKGKFYIPVLMSGATNTKTDKVNESDTVSLDIPACLKIFFGPNKIPAKTKFLVAFTAGDINQARIIGLYDTEQYRKFAWDYAELEKKVKRLINAVRTLQNMHGIKQDWSDKE